MYLTLGDTVLSDKSIIGIFDMDATTVSVRTREFLRAAQQEGRVVNTTFDLPKAFVVAAPRGKRARTEEKVYITQYMPSTIAKK